MVAHPRRHPERGRTGRYPGVRRHARGQSLAEFVLILPLMLGFLGLTVDFARVFQAWLTLESATRDAAEAAATSATDSAGALSIARRTVCLQAQDLPGFTPSGLASPQDVEQCAAPSVTVTSFNLSTSAPGASTRYPIGSATVRSTLPFRPLFAYPVITQDGTWTIVVSTSISIVQGRE